MMTEANALAIKLNTYGLTYEASVLEVMVYEMNNCEKVLRVKENE